MRIPPRLQSSSSPASPPAADGDDACPGKGPPSLRDAEPEERQVRHAEGESGRAGSLHRGQIPGRVPDRKKREGGKEREGHIGGGLPLAKGGRRPFEQDGRQAFHGQDEPARSEGGPPWPELPLHVRPCGPEDRPGPAPAIAAVQPGSPWRRKKDGRFGKGERQCIARGPEQAPLEGRELPGYVARRHEADGRDIPFRCSQRHCGMIHFA